MAEWKTGDVITAEKLNHMEDGIESGAGYKTIETRTLVFNGDITTEIYSGDNFATYDTDYGVPYIPDALYITFNNVEYFCKKIKFQEDDNVYYGGKIEYDYSFVDYPFVFVLYNDGIGFVTENAGTYNFKIEEAQINTTTTPAFNSAVSNAMSENNTNIFTIKIDYNPFNDECIIDKTFLELFSSAYDEVLKVLVFNGNVIPIEAFNTNSENISLVFSVLSVDNGVTATIKQYTITIFEDNSYTLSIKRNQWNVTYVDGDTIS